MGAQVSAVSWGTALQVGRSRVRFPVVSLEFFIDINLIAALWPWGRWVGLMTLPPSCADCLEIWETDSSGNLRTCADLYRDRFTSICYHFRCFMRHNYNFGVLYLICVFWPMGTRWCSWLRHCATSRRVAGSIHRGVIGIFHWHNPSGPGVDPTSNRNE